MEEEKTQETNDNFNQNSFDTHQYTSANRSQHAVHQFGIITGATGEVNKPSAAQGNNPSRQKVFTHMRVQTDPSMPAQIHVMR